MKTQNSAQPQGHSTPAQMRISGQEEDGLFPGTIILTQRGEVPVEHLTKADKVITRNSGFSPLLDVTHHWMDTNCVRVRAGSLGHTRPEADMDLPASQHVLIRDWRAESIFGQSQAFAPIGALVDEEFITDLGQQYVVVYQLSFERPQVIYAGGMELCIYPRKAQHRHAA